MIELVSLTIKLYSQSNLLESNSYARANTLKASQRKELLFTSCSGCVLDDSGVAKEELRSRLGVSKIL